MIRVVAVALAGALAATRAMAQAPPSPPASPAPSPGPSPEARSTGLPSGLDWTFNIDATVATFGFMNSLYNDPKPEQPSGDLGDNWLEGSAKPAIGATYTAANTAQLYGKLSVVGERTYGAAPSLVGEDASSYNVEDLHIGWRSGTSLGSSENLVELTFGRAQYQLGHGFLLYDGAAEGGNRGGYWTNARKAFALAAIGRLQPGHHTLEVFYLDKDDLPEADSGSRLWGANYEYAIGEDTTLGATYMKWMAKPDVNPGRDGLDVYNARVFTAPFPGLKALSFELEYAREDNGDALDSTAWTGQAAYQFGGRWTPRVSYRYAFFEGDDPATPRNEAFDPLFLGFHDWGSWWQGEIAGEYFVSNSNLITHQLRLHVTPTESIGTGLIFYRFLLDRPEAQGPEVTSDDIGFEADWYMDWKVNDNFTFSFVGAYLNPGDAVQQAFDRTKSFAYGMISLAYSY
jgi:alginate export protein